MKNLKIAIKIPMIVIIAALLSSIAVGAIGIKYGEDALVESTEYKLQAILYSRKAKMDIYLQSISDDLAFVATNSQTIQALKDFKYGWDSIEGSKEAALQDLYITKNPNELGQKHLLDYAKDGSLYSEMHKEHHPWFRQFLEARGYYDIFIFDLDGNLIYTVFKELDYATNLANGEYKNTDLGNAYRAAAASSAGKEDQFFYDFKPYSPSAGAPAAFMSTPIYQKNKKVGVLVYQMPIDKINEAMAFYQGLGETGETYLVGSDNLMRSNSRFFEKSTILKTKVVNESVDNALAGQTGIGHLENYRGVEVYSAYTLIKFMGVDWAILSEQERTEAEAKFVEMEASIEIAAVIVVLILGLLGYIVARTIVKPLQRTNEDISKLAEGKLDVDVSGTNRKDEIGDLAKSALIFKENAIEKERLGKELKVTDEKTRKQKEASEQEKHEREEAATEETKQAEIRAEQDKKKAMGDLANKFEERVQAIINSVSAASTQLRTTAQAMSISIDNTSSTAITAAKDADQTSANVESIAAATEEMVASVNEISSQMQQSTQIVSDSVSKMDLADSKASALGNATNKVKDVIKFISDISSQINLLALNATIESARAGEAGKGFAVVANEVKNLAAETDKSLAEVDKVIIEMNSASDDIITSLADIKESIESISNSSATVSAATEEQSATTREISENIQIASEGTTNVSRSLASVSDSSEQASMSAKQVLTAAEQLTQQANDLDSQVEIFLKEIRGE